MKSVCEGMTKPQLNKFGLFIMNKICAKENLTEVYRVKWDMKIMGKRARRVGIVFPFFFQHKTEGTLEQARRTLAQNRRTRCFKQRVVKLSSF